MRFRPDGLLLSVVVPPDFLNSREDAILVWTVAIVGYAVWKDPRASANQSLASSGSWRHPGPHVPAGSKPGPLQRSLLKFARWEWHYRWNVRPRLVAELEGRRETQRVVVLRGRTNGWLGDLLSGNSS